MSEVSKAAKSSATSELQLRPYRRNDLDAMVALDRICFAPEFLFGKRAMRQFVEAAGAYGVVAERGSAIVGFAITQVEPRTNAHTGQPQADGPVAYCVTLDVSPGERRAGLGGILLGELERWAHAKGARSMMLHVWVGNEGARRFYGQQGYRVVGDAPGFYGRGIDALLCRKHL